MTPHERIARAASLRYDGRDAERQRPLDRASLRGYYRRRIYRGGMSAACLPAGVPGVRAAEWVSEKAK